jgi:hypothetical protein
MKQFVVDPVNDIAHGDFGSVFFWLLFEATSTIFLQLNFNGIKASKTKWFFLR